MNAKEFLDWEQRKKEEANDLKAELIEVVRKSPRTREFVTVLTACLEMEWQKYNIQILTGQATKEELIAYKKAIEVAKRLINTAIEE